ncbi:MAG: T9SS type A sorting domain-containing protein [Bacteroidia bacterium]|nr:T9SS type A sorting domain-containing protein [Bacteroidia bacterium]
MKKLLLATLLLFVTGLTLNAQTILYSETFNSNLGTTTATNSSNGAWAWSNSCAQSSLTGHSAPGHAIFQGSGCQFGNGSSTTSGDLRTPTVVIGALGGTLTFNYFVANECGSGSCTYDILRMSISNNNGASYTDIVSSSSSPGGLSNTSGWTSVSYNLSAYASQTIIVKFNFDSVDGIGNAYDGIYVDDILITGACSINLFATSGSSTVAPAVCSGGGITLNTNAVSNYSWSTGSTASTIAVSPSVNTTYTLSAMSVSNCMSSTVITVTVSAGAPVLSVTTNTNNVCFGKTVILTASGANSYTWSGGVINGTGFTPSVSGTYTVTGLNGCGTGSATTSITVAPLVVSLLASPSVVCSGQTAVLNVAAAANNYTWMPINSSSSSNSVSVSPQNTTIYTVTASDGTCSGTSTVSLNALPIPTISIVSSSSVVCAGDAVTMTASGGLTYTWTPGNMSTPNITVNPTAPTAYSVGATNSLGCSAGNVAVVITNPSPTVTAVSSDVLICAGGTATLTAGGASNYTWSSGPTTSVTVESPLSTTVYTVTGELSGCNGTETVSIEVYTPSVSIAGNTVLCDGMSTTLTASGADTYTWLPNNPFPALNVTPLATTIYTVTSITATGNINCADTQTIQVTVNPNPTVTAVSSRTSMCKAETITVTASGAGTYSWSTFATSPSIVVTSTLVTTLNISVVGTNSFGCSNTANVQIKVNGCVGINENNLNLSNLVVYPNPSNEWFMIESESTIELSLVNQLGQVIKTISLNASNKYKAKVNGLSSGVYFVMGQNGIKSVSQKVVVD